MFQSLIHRVSDALHHTISRYVSRVIVAVPVVVAIAFATAAAATELSSRYGATISYLVLAGVFVLIALIAAAVMAARGDASTVTHTPPSSVLGDTQRTDGTAIPFQLDPALLLMAGRLAGPTAARALVRNWPLVIGVLVLAWLLLSDPPKQNEAPAAEPAE